MEEIELKITHLSKSEILARLARIGALKTFPETKVTDMFFAKRNAEGPIKYSTLRLRKLGKQGQLTVKTKQKDSSFKVYKELQVDVSDTMLTRKILETLGFKLTSVRQKIREEFSWKDVVIEIDTYPGMQPYLEIESNNRQSLLKFLKAFGVPLNHTNTHTAKELIIKAGLNPDKLLFPYGRTQGDYNQKQKADHRPIHHAHRRTDSTSTTSHS